MDEKNQILTSNIWLDLTWTDSQLIWNSSEYGGVQVNHISPWRVANHDMRNN